jgi:hypothetical protein
MNGAHEYAGLFKTGQYGQLYITSSSHARGKTFRVQVLPKGEVAAPNGPNTCLNSDAVEVYGIIGGQPGWTERYGWIHKGRWQDDFEKLVATRRQQIAAKENAEAEAAAKRRAEDAERKAALLASY